MKTLGAHLGKGLVGVAGRRELGELLDELGVTAEVEPDEQMCGAMVLMMVQEPDGHLSVRAAWSDGMSWIERIGLLRAAERAELPSDGAHDWRV